MCVCTGPHPELTVAAAVLVLLVIVIISLIVLVVIWKQVLVAPFRLHSHTFNSSLAPLGNCVCSKVVAKLFLNKSKK